jgi:hypothetical protein
MLSKIVSFDAVDAFVSKFMDQLIDEVLEACAKELQAKVLPNLTQAEVAELTPQFISENRDEVLARLTSRQLNDWLSHDQFEALFIQKINLKFLDGDDCGMLYKYAPGSGKVGVAPFFNGLNINSKKCGHYALDAIRGMQSHPYDALVPQTVDYLKYYCQMEGWDYDQVEIDPSIYYSRDGEMDPKFMRFVLESEGYSFSDPVQVGEIDLEAVLAKAPLDFAVLMTSKSNVRFPGGKVEDQLHIIIIKRDNEGQWWTVDSCQPFQNVLPLKAFSPDLILMLPESLDLSI